MSRAQFLASLSWIAWAARFALLIALFLGAALAWYEQTHPALADTEQMLACAATGDVEGVRYALEAGVPANACDGAAIGLAVSYGNAAMLRLLLEHGADPSGASGTAYPPLMMACLSGKTEVVALLLNAGADANEVSGYLQTPLGIAAWVGNERAVELLLARGASVAGVARGDPSKRYPPLVSAARSGVASPGLLRRLIAAGADVNAPDDEGTTPLGAARAARRADLVDLLIRAGARPDSATPGPRQAATLSAIN
jgi:ankyrin repeat protein